MSTYFQSPNSYTPGQVSNGALYWKRRFDVYVHTVNVRPLFVDFEAKYDANQKRVNFDILIKYEDVILQNFHDSINISNQLSFVSAGGDFFTTIHFEGFDTLKNKYVDIAKFWVNNRVENCKKTGQVSNIIYAYKYQKDNKDNIVVFYDNGSGRVQQMKVDPLKCISSGGGGCKVRKGSYESMTVKMLQERCKKRGIAYSGKKKAELIKALRG